MNAGETKSCGEAGGASAKDEGIVDFGFAGGHCDGVKGVVRNLRYELG